MMTDRDVRDHVAHGAGRARRRLRRRRHRETKRDANVSSNPGDLFLDVQEKSTGGRPSGAAVINAMKTNP